MIKNLVEYGYLRQNPENKQYLLSTKFLYFSDRVQQQFDLIPIAKPYLQQLSSDTEASANLCVQDNQVVVYIDHVYNHRQMLRTFTHLGARAPLYATGVGKIFLSQMTDGELEGYIDRTEMERFTDNTITDRDALIKEIEGVRKKGYAIDEQEKSIGVRCIAAPIYNHNNEIVAAISISGATLMIPSKRIKALSELVMNSAVLISAQLGYKVNGGEHSVNLS